MEIEIAAILTIAGKLEVLDKLLERRILRAATDTVSPALPLLNKVYRLGEYKRLAANIAVMEHCIRCGLDAQEVGVILAAAERKSNLHFANKRVQAAVKKAYGILSALGVSLTDLQGYKALPLYRAECKRLQKICAKPQTTQTEQAAQAAQEGVFIPYVHAAACAAHRVDRTVRA